MHSISYFLIFLTGLAGGVHCVAMCGGISSAFALQLPPNVSRLKLIVCLNLGRLMSYTFIGLILGGLSQITTVMDGTQMIKNILFIIANIILFFLGLYLAGFSKLITKIELLGLPIWQKLNLVLQKILPIKNSFMAFCVGGIWGWLPCGLVYSASTYALSSANTLQGALIMFCFGLGTLPNLLAMGFFASTMTTFMTHKFTRLALGSIIMIFAIFQLTLFIYRYFS